MMHKFYKHIVGTKCIDELVQLAFACLWPMLDEGLAHHSFYASSEYLPRPASKARQVGHVKLRFVFRTSELAMCNGLR